MKNQNLPIKHIPNKGFCGECDDFVSFHVEHFKNQVHKVKGVEITTDEYIGICNKCGNHLWIKPVEDHNCKIIYDEYKKKVGLLTTDEIKEIRKKRGMSQKDLAKFLSIGEKDITRYENGSIQTKAVDLMIRMVGDDIAYSAMSNLISKNKLKVAEAQ